MRVLKNKAFSKWAAKEGLGDSALIAAVEQMERGLVDANLGGHVFKKRVITAGRGKVAVCARCWLTKPGIKRSSCMASPKMRDPTSRDYELEGLNKLAKELLTYTDRALARAIESGAIIEVEDDG